MNDVAMVVRIYVQEAEHILTQVLSYLHDEAKVKGVTVLRGIAGYGSSGKLHTTQLTDLSLNLPLIIEFFESESKVNSVIENLKTMVKPHHIISWPVKVY